jgi:hypothetical protein
MEQNKYVVKILHFFANYIDIAADNEEQAKQKVKDILNKEDIISKFKHYYEATIPEENWGVITKEEFDKLQLLENAAKDS